MTKTIVLDETQQQALMFLCAGRHQTQMEPHFRRSLDAIETQLRDVPIDESQVVAEEEPGTMSPPPKAKRGDK